MDPTTSGESPEERELGKKRRELAALESQLADQELDLATRKADLRAFDALYLRIVGLRLAQLDEVEAQIAAAKARLRPADTAARQQAERARSQAQRSAEEAGPARVPSLEGRFQPSEELKRAYREVAKQLHPDLATDEEQRAARTRLMAEANRAYEDDDLARLVAILNEWHASPEFIKGDGPGAELVRIIRKIAQVEIRMEVIAAEIASLKESDLYKLKATVEDAQTKGRELLAEMALRLDERITLANQRLLNLATSSR